MALPVPYLLDTNVVLFATRQHSPAATAIEQQFGLKVSPFRPAICEVTVAELLAFAESWGQARRKDRGHGEDRRDDPDFIGRSCVLAVARQSPGGRRSHRSPIARNLLRGPGHSLRSCWKTWASKWPSMSHC